MTCPQGGVHAWVVLGGGTRYCSQCSAQLHTCLVCGKALDPSRDPAVTTLGPRCALHWHSPAH